MNDRADNNEIDELLHPASAFGHPSEVVNDPDLTLKEKRAAKHAKQQQHQQQHKDWDLK